MSWKPRIFTWLNVFIGLFLLSFIVIGVGMLGSGVWQVLQQRQHQDWPTTPAEISVLKQTDSEPSILQLTYAYGGKTYQQQFSTRAQISMQNGGVKVLGHSDLLKRIARQAGRKRVQIYVNPSKPNDIRVNRYPKPREYFMIMFGIMFSALPLWLVARYVLSYGEVPLRVETRGGA
ncbi:MAG: DUF3592 domain-containing protein [Bacteroidota bacterium]